MAWAFVEAANFAGTIGSFKHNGTNRAGTPGGVFDLTTTRCNGAFLVMNGKLQFENGICEKIDRDGDKWVLRFSRSDLRGSYQVVSGSGKYAGISGEGWYEPLGEFPPPGVGKEMACFRLVGTYQLR